MKSTVKHLKNTVTVIISSIGVAINAYASSPHLELDSTYIDMGRVPLDSIGEATMHFRNTGDEDLEIFRIFSECGCTVPSYPSEAISPGGEGEIRIRFNGKGRRPGSFRKALRIRSNAGNARQVLIVKGHIK